MMKLGLSFVGIALVAAVASVSFVNLRQEAGEGASAGVANVTLAQAERRDIVVQVKGRGKIVPKQQVEYWLPAGASLLELSVHLGQTVRKGQVIGRLGDDELEKEQYRASMDLLAAQAEVEQLTSGDGDEGVARTRRDAELAKLELELKERERGLAKELLDAKAVSAKSFDEADLEVKRATYRYQGEMQRLAGAEQRTRVALRLAKMKLERAEKSLEDLQRRLATLTWQAPFTGVVTRSDPSGAHGAAKMPLVILASLETLQAKLQISTYDIAQVSAGQRVDIKLDGRDERLAGVVAGVGFEVVSKQMVIGGENPNIVEVIANLHAPTAKPVTLGTEVEAAIAVAAFPQRITVPAEAIMGHGAETYVWVADNSRVERRSVVIGANDTDRVEITGGLRAGEHIVVRGQIGLHQGQELSESVAAKSSNAAPAVSVVEPVSALGSVAPMSANMEVH